MSGFNINNADMPANPVPEAVNQRFTDKSCRWSVDESGLTKREELAARAMIGLIANHHGTGGEFERCAQDAVAHADALLEELDKERDQ